MGRYAVITSDVPDGVLDYLNRKKMDFKLFDFNPVLDLSSIHFQQRKNGWYCWKDCDNFIEGLEWENYRIKPKNEREAQEGNLSPDRSCNRGWTKFKCKAYKGKERFLRWDKGKEVTDNNPNGIVNGSSWIICDMCAFYSPRTLDGRIHVLEKVEQAYETRIREVRGQIGSLREELKKQTSGSK